MMLKFIPAFVLFYATFMIDFTKGKLDVEMPIWPHPKHAKLGSGQPAVVIPSKSFFVFKSGTRDAQIARRLGGTTTSSDSIPKILEKGFARYEKICFPKPWHSRELADSFIKINRVEVYVVDCDESHPQLGHDESYTLTLTKDDTRIEAGTIWGALHALETLSQLIEYDYDSKQYIVERFPVEIQDEPRFSERGLMLDTARHFETIPTIMRLIASLPHAKINVFHWHMSDTESFPMESKAAPNLWKGSYSNEERFSTEEVAMVVEYARYHGVRVIVEFDMPGHAQSWCKGYPEMCPSVSCLTPLNVGNPKTFEIIESLFLEVTGGKASTRGNPQGLFPDNLIHLGGDEVDTKCWDTVPAIVDWKNSRNMSSVDAYAFFSNQVAKMVIAQGRRPVQWVEVFEQFPDRLPKETIVHIWKSADYVGPVTKKGLNCILSNPDWYLDHLGVNWTTIYQNEPCIKVSDEQCKLVLGGHGEMWGETVDSSDVFSTVWPKLAAIGERLWSPRSVNSVESARPRLQNFRCLLNQRGIGAAPLLNKESREPPPHQASCYAQ